MKYVCGDYTFLSLVSVINGEIMVSDTKEDMISDVISEVEVSKTPYENTLIVRMGKHNEMYITWSSHNYTITYQFVKYGKVIDNCVYRVHKKVWERLNNIIVD